MDQHEPAEKNYDLERLVFFSDGVFAIVITLLVLDLRVPTGWDLTVAGLWKAEWKALLGYAFSFGAVGVYWNRHRRLFRPVVRFRPALVFLNLLFLSIVVLMPFGAELVITGSSVAVAIFLGLIIAIGVAQALLWGFAALFRDVVDPRLDRSSRLKFLSDLLIAPLVLGALLAVVLVGSRSAAVWAAPALVLLGLVRWLLARRTKR